VETTQIYEAARALDAEAMRHAEKADAYRAAAKALRACIDEVPASALWRTPAEREKPNTSTQPHSKVAARRSIIIDSLKQYGELTPRQLLGFVNCHTTTFQDILVRMVGEGLVEAIGATNSRRYRLPVPKAEGDPPPIASPIPTPDAESTRTDSGDDAPVELSDTASDDSDDAPETEPDAPLDGPFVPDALASKVTRRAKAIFASGASYSLSELTRNVRLTVPDATLGAVSIICERLVASKAIARLYGTNPTRYRLNGKAPTSAWK
jgi:hypothetical protein